MARTYPTHLDALVADVRLPGTLEMARHYGIDPKATPDDALFLGKVLGARVMDMAERLEGLAAVDQSQVTASIVYETCVTAFCINKNDGPLRGLLAIQPDAETTAMLADAKPPVSDEPKKIVDGRAVWIDLTRANLRLEGHPDYSVAAMFGLGAVGRLKPGEERLDRAQIGFVYLSPAERDIDPEWIITWIHGTPDEADGRRPPWISPDALIETARRLDAFFDLVLLYHASSKPETKAPLPTLVPKQRDRKDARNPARLQRSFFRIESLRPPADRLGRGEVKGGGWTLDVRQNVKGFFRWQPHGPGNSLRKLIWVDDYVRGPAEGRVRPVIEQI